MAGIENFAFYLFSAFIFTITPGLDTVLILNRSLTNGRRAGILSSIGISAGILCHTALAAFGLSMLITQSETAFTLLRYLGAAYLSYMGASKLFSRKAPDIRTSKSQKADQGFCYFFLSGLATNLLNPKVILFFIAFFPQFVRPGYYNAPQPYVILGLVYTFISVLWLSCLSILSALLAHRLLHSRTFTLWLDRFAGLIFLFMGIKIALSET